MPRKKFSKGQIVAREYKADYKTLFVMYGIKGDCADGKQIYPYSSFAEAKQEYDFRRFKQRNRGKWTYGKQNPKDATTD